MGEPVRLVRGGCQWSEFEGTHDFRLLVPYPRPIPTLMIMVQKIPSNNARGFFIYVLFCFFYSFIIIAFDPLLFCVCLIFSDIIFEHLERKTFFSPYLIELLQLYGAPSMRWREFLDTLSEGQRNCYV